MQIECNICYESLRGPPFQDSSLNSRIVATSCGHVFHDHCVTQYWDSRNADWEAWDEYFSDGIRCPTRMIRVRRVDNRRIYLDFQDDRKVEELREQFEQLSLRNGAPFLRGLAESPDTTCMNCEASSHQTRDCEEYVILRILQSTENSKFVPCFTFVSSTILPGATAKEVIEDFLTPIERPNEDLGRNQLQMLNSCYYFAKFCWYRASPMHRDFCPFKEIVASWGPRTAMNRFRKRAYELSQL